jgi:hypothetical protein
MKNKSESGESLDDIENKPGAESFGLNTSSQISDATVEGSSNMSNSDEDILTKAQAVKSRNQNTPKRPWYKKLLNKKAVIIAVIVIAVLAGLSIIPQTRYPIFGLFWKQNYEIVLLDSQTNHPVTAATITLAGQTATTDNKGDAHIKVKVGHQLLIISKKYYANLSSNVLVPLHSHGTKTFSLTATGRQIPVTVINRINAQPIENAIVKAAGSEAHTDSKGQVTIVLPADQSSIPATISAGGYNDSSAVIQITTQTTSLNSFQLTPSGKVYFLSKLSGKIDVVKTNLDGTDRQTVLAGTGFEDDQNTVLLASRDWKYLALDSIRSSGGNAELNLIDTTNGDSLTNIDKGDAIFTSVGWLNDDFIYLVLRKNVQSWQSNAASIKSYNAQTGKLIALDGTKATGTSNIDAKYENLFSSNIYLVGSQIIYAKTWYLYPGYLSVPGEQNTLNSINADGSGKKVVATLDATNTYFSSLLLYKPLLLYVQTASSSTDQTLFYTYDSSGTYSKSTDPQASTYFNQTYPTYLVSPSGNKTFWSEPRDGKNTLFVGDKAGQNQKQIASLSDYVVYGWYSDNYLLVSKNSSELYILPVEGGTALKITDYNKPVQNFNGYGGGYGGL